jgi:hypothetical protein
MFVRSSARTNPVGSLLAAASTVSSSNGNEFAIACDQIADQRGIAARTSLRNPTERAEHQFGRKAGKGRVIGIVHAGWKLRLIRIKVASTSDCSLV